MTISAWALIERIVPDEVPYPEPQPEGQEGPAEPASRALTGDGTVCEIITSMAEAHGVDPMLVRALIRSNPATSHSALEQGSHGADAADAVHGRAYNVRNPYDPKANIAAGVKHLKSLIDRFASVDLALAAYNAGEAP